MPKTCLLAIRGVLAFALVIACPILVPAPTQAQNYPSRSVKIIVPFPAGGTADAIPRVIGDWLSRKWGQPVIIENRSGAGGNVGAELAYRSEPDGYTLLSAPPPPLVINQNLYQNLAFDPAQFEPVIVVAQVPNALIVNPNNIAATTVAEFIAYLKANPGKATSATQGIGTTHYKDCSQATSILCSITSAYRCHSFRVENCACSQWRRANVLRRYPMCRR